jgi:hypothetical protein
MDKFCIGCGTTINSQAKFCGGCGQAISDITAPAVNSLDALETGTAPESTATPVNRKSGLIVGSLIAFAAVTALGFYAFNGISKDAVSSQSDSTAEGAKPEDAANAQVKYLIADANIRSQAKTKNAAKDEAVVDAAASNAIGTVNGANASAAGPGRTRVTCDLDSWAGTYKERVWSSVLATGFNGDQVWIWVPSLEFGRACTQQSNKAVQPTAPIPSYPPADYVAGHWIAGTNPKGCTRDGTILQFRKDGSKYQSLNPCTVAP